MQFIPPQEALTRFVSHHMVIPGFSVIAKRASMAELGDYDEALGPQSDYFLNHALAALHGAVSSTRRSPSGAYPKRPIVVPPVMTTIFDSCPGREKIPCAPTALQGGRTSVRTIPCGDDRRPSLRTFSAPSVRYGRRFCDLVPPDAFVTKTSKGMRATGKLRSTSELKKLEPFSTRCAGAGPVVPLETAGSGFQTSSLAEAGRGIFPNAR